MDKIDKETEKIITEAEKAQRFIVTEGWNIAKRLIDKKIAEISDVSTFVLEGRMPGDIERELRERQSVIDIIKSWVNEIEGVAMSAQYNVVTPVQEDDIIKHY